MHRELVQLLEFAVQQNASDIHLTPDSSPWLRIRGELIQFSHLEILSADGIKQFIYSVMSAQQQAIVEKQWELDFAVHFSPVANFRVNVFYQMHGMAAVFRVIPKKIPTLDELALPAQFKALLELKHGLILVAGSTGSGKSTTLAAMIDYINTMKTAHVITIEDPIEFIHHSKASLISQRQVQRDTHDFATALRSALREDPDVILVGEMRDLETIRLALTAAETGHLVMATLHATSAPRAVSRMIDVFPSGEKSVIRNLLAESLQAVICQTLINKIPTGRVPAFEVMLGRLAIRNLIREDKIPQMYSAMQVGGQVGMWTLAQYLQELVNKGVIHADNVKQVAI